MTARATVHPTNTVIRITNLNFPHMLVLPVRVHKPTRFSSKVDQMWSFVISKYHQSWSASRGSMISIKVLSMWPVWAAVPPIVSSSNTHLTRSKQYILVMHRQVRWFVTEITRIVAASITRSSRLQCILRPQRPQFRDCNRRVLTRIATIGQFYLPMVMDLKTCRLYVKETCSRDKCIPASFSINFPSKCKKCCQLKRKIANRFLKYRCKIQNHKC